MYQKRNNYYEVISLFLGNYKTQFFLREISRLSGTPLKTTQNILGNFEKDKILISSIEGKNKYYTLNLENIQTKHLLLQSEAYKTSKFIEKYKPLKTFLKEINSDALIIVFGSFAKLMADENSDLDMLIIDKKNNIPYYLIPYKIHKINMLLNVFLKSVEKQETLIKEIIRNHIILNNHSLFINVFWGYYAK